MSSNNNGVHILVFPFPAQGHMLALLDLARQLSLRGLTITILVTPRNIPILNPLLSANASIQTLVFPFPSDPSIPPGVENLKDLGNHGNMPFIAALSRLQNPIFQWFKSHSNLLWPFSLIRFLDGLITWLTSLEFHGLFFTVMELWHVLFLNIFGQILQTWD
ncbi:UNVERIFIED_CONTAM: UDP-glycosyltransferase 89A2 [Sesamum radiatum]|uniref:UDP-glycosyltransferase 89A2 n=1 Tax=Sesamum radiatum TaxID=300843 RepID=A0AAW2TW15_SESRA